MEKRINILFIIDILRGPGGTEKHLLYLVKLLDKKIFNCSIIAFHLEKNMFTNQFGKSGAKVIHIPVGRYYTINALRQAFKISQFIRDNNIDIVQTFHFKSDFYGALVARLSGVRHIISSKRDVGDLKNNLHFLLTRSVGSTIQTYIVVSDIVGKVVMEREKVPPQKIFKIYNGVDVDKFFPPDPHSISTSRSMLGLGASDFVVGTVSWFRPEKSHDILLKAIRDVIMVIRNLKLVTIGGGPLLNYYRREVERIGLSGNVVFTGAVNDVEKYIDCLDVGCLVPGLNEGFSNSILEKMAKGLPLIVTDVGGNREAVLHKYNGFVIPPNDYKALSKCIIDLYEDPEKRKKMGIRSRGRAEQHFALREMIEKHEELYKLIVRK